jgi:Tfp pilus assembly protein FimT
MELMVVMSLIGLIAVVSTSMLIGPNVVQSLAAREEAELFKTTLRLARTTAITNGSEVRIESLNQGGYRVTDANGSLLQPEHRFAANSRVRWSDNSIAFQPSGMSDHSLSVVFMAAVRTWQVDVLSGSGQVLMQEFVSR